MASHSQELQELIVAGRIRLRDGEFLRRSPEPLAAGLEFSGVRGMLLGLTIGDALGNTSEGMTPADRTARFGEIRDYLQHPRFGDARG